MLKLLPRAMSGNSKEEKEWSKYLKLVAELQVCIDIDDDSFDRDRLSEEETNALLAVFSARYKNQSFKIAGKSIGKEESTIKSQFTSIYTKFIIGTKKELFEKLQRGFGKYLEELQIQTIDRSLHSEPRNLIDLPHDKTVWDMLLDLAVYATDRFGIIYPPNIPVMGMGGDYLRHQQNKIQTKIPRGKHVLLEIPKGLTGYLVLLEDRAHLGDVLLLSPSCWMENSQLDGKPIQLPKPSTLDYQGIQLVTLGETHLWAGVFETLPDWEWLKPLQKNLQSLDASHLRQLHEYAESQPSETKTLLRSNYTVVA
jgi:hypothetical protein